MSFDVLYANKQALGNEGMIFINNKNNRMDGKNMDFVNHSFNDRNLTSFRYQTYSPFAFGR